MKQRHYLDRWHQRVGTGISGPVILGLLYQGLIVGGLCFVIQASLLRYHSAMQIAVFDVGFEQTNRGGLHS